MGSHDFSPSEKTMIRPLVSAEFFVDVSKGFMEEEQLFLEFTEDKKTKIKLTGLRARKRSLEIEDYTLLDTESLEQEKGIKIFVMHTMLQELKPLEYKDMLSAPKSVIPQGFLYYAAGHLHKTVPEVLRQEKKLKLSDETRIIYPGCLFPVNFRELESFHYGGFCMLSGEVGASPAESSLQIEYIPVQVKEVVNLNLDCTGKTVQKVIDTLTELLKKENFTDKLVTLRLFGTLSSGKSYEIKVHEITEQIKAKGAYEVLINKSFLMTREYTSVRVDVGKTNEEIEETLIQEHAQKSQVKGISKIQLENIIHELLSVLGNEREEGMKVNDYNKHLIKIFSTIFQLDSEKMEEETQ